MKPKWLRRVSALKNPERDPFSGNRRARATQTIQTSPEQETHETPRKGFARRDHVLFTRLVISGAVS
jgi:hypothetical protein